MDRQDKTWRKRAKRVWRACELELRRTTAIGVRMVHASKASTELKETYEELGKTLVRALREGRLEWKEPQVKILVSRVEELEAQLLEMEGQVQDLKRPDSYERKI